MSDQHRVVRPEANAFGTLIARLRQERGLSQKDLAARAQVNPSTINRVEGKERGVSRELVERLAASLELNNADRVDLLLAAGVVDQETATLLQSPGLSRLAQVLASPDIRAHDRSQLLLYVDLALAYADALGYLVPAAWDAHSVVDRESGAVRRNETESASGFDPIDAS